jgi:hypothetical protein
MAYFPSNALIRRRSGGSGTTLKAVPVCDGADGDVTITTSVTLTAIANYNNLTITSSGTLTVGAGFYSVYAKETININSGGVLRALSTDGLAGGTGTTTTGNVGASEAMNQWIALSGGAGGAGSSGAGGAGGANTATGPELVGLFQILTKQSLYRPTATTISMADFPSAPSGGGGGGNGASTGATGGRGAGFILLACNELINDGSIQANGGNGSNAGGSGRGGGGGGSGGIVLVYSQKEMSGSGAVSVTGGTGGTGGGSGGLAGSSGGDGVFYEIKDFFGLGIDGDITISSSTSLTRDMHYNSLTIDTGASLDTNNCKIRCKDFFTINDGMVENNGNNASGTVGGAEEFGSMIKNGGGGGGARVNGRQRKLTYGSGAGGTGGDFTAGNGYGGYGGVGNQDNVGSYYALAGLAGRINATGGNFTLTDSASYAGMAGGGGGGSGSGASYGAGGGGGGIVYIAAKTINLNGGSVTATGGNGANASGGSSGGGGGGGGGIIFFIYETKNGSSTTTTVTGGTAGTSNGVGAPVAGTSGTVFNFEI